MLASICTRMLSTDPIRQPSLGSLVRRHAMAIGERIALVENDTALSYRDLDRRADALAAHLEGLGVGAGDRIAVLAFDGIPVIELMVAASRVGAIVLLLNWRLAATEIASLIDVAAPVAIFFSQRHEHLVPDRPWRECVAMPVLFELHGRYHDLATADVRPRRAGDIAGNAPLYVMFTSGTTGRAKGCVHSHATAIAAGMTLIVTGSITVRDVLFSGNPLFHVSGLQPVLAALVSGAAIVPAPRDADDAQILALLAKTRPTFGTMSAALRKALAVASDAQLEAMNFRLLFGGAGIDDPANWSWVKKKLNAVYHGGWGQTEVGGFAIGLDHEAMIAHPGAIGWPLPLREIAVLDASGVPMADALAEGEMGVRGPSVMLGYLDDPAATDSALGTGWLRTGDLARRDEHGLLHMLGRAKELIKSGGENVYPAEVENVLREHPAILDLAVAGVADAKWGEAVKLFAVLRSGQTITADEVTLLCRAAIAGYKRPRYLEIIDAIPRNAQGKILRHLLSARPVTPDQAIP